MPFFTPKRRVTDLCRESRAEQYAREKADRPRAARARMLRAFGFICLGILTFSFGWIPGVAAMPILGMGLVSAPRPPRFANYIAGLQGVASSGIATVNAQVDRRYHSMRILTTNAAGALTDPTTIVSLVELVVNGIVVRTGLPATFINIAKTYRYTPGTGEIPIFFTEFWRNETPRAAEATSWDMYGQRTFVVRLTFLAPGGGVGVQSILADFDGERNTRLDSSGVKVAFLAIVRQTDISINGINGQNDVVTIPTTFPIQRIYTDVSANAISSVQIFADNNVKVWEATKTENQYLLNANDITATFFEYPIIFDYDDRIESNLKTSYLDVRVNTTGVATLTFHVHHLLDGYR